MSIFVSKEPVPVTVDGVNTIYIRPKMGYGIEQKVIGEATKFTQAAKSRNGAKPASPTVEVNIGAYNLALLTNNIMKWEGPEFGPTPCTPENIALLDDSDPLVEMVLKEISDRNKSAKEEEPEHEEEGAPGPIEGEYQVISPNSRNGGGKGSQAHSRKMLESTTLN